MNTRVGLLAIAILAACEPRVSVGDLGESSGGSAGSKPNGELPVANAGASAVAPTGEAGAGGAGLAGPDEETGGTSAGGGGSNAGSSGSAGSGPNPLTPYAARSGSFKLLAYSRTADYRHDSAILGGRALLQQIADEQGFELVATEDNAFLANLSSFEVLFFLNTSGDVFNQQEERVFEQWMTRGGGFVGTHSAAATEPFWDFYSEVTGQYYNGHGPAGVTTNLELEPTMLDHPTLAGLPNPWQHTDEWARFDSYLQWSVKPGFKILVRNSTDATLVSWLREWGSFRAFYTALGHDGTAYTDPILKQHLAGAIMWAARREHLLK